MKHHPKFLLTIIFLSVGLVLQAAQANESQNAKNKVTENLLTGVIFENVRIFNGTATELSVPSNVLVAGNVIKLISVETIANPDGMKIIRIQGGGRTLIPGLIDNHVHLFMTGSSEMVMLNPKISVETLNATTIKEAEKMLLRGFTTVRDVGGPVFDAKNPSTTANPLAPAFIPAAV